MRYYHFKEGEDVAHKECLSDKLIVRRIIKKKVKIPGTDKDIDKFIGLECAWWQGSGDEKKYVKSIFHSRELVPWEIAQKGEKEVIKWLTGEAGNDGQKSKESKPKNGDKD